jgi:hypothetical protein
MKPAPHIRAFSKNLAATINADLYVCSKSNLTLPAGLNVCAVSAAPQFASYLYMFTQELPETPKVLL